LFRINKINIYHDDEKTVEKVNLIFFNERVLINTIFILSFIALIGLFLKLKILSDYAGGFYEYLENPIRARFIVSQNIGKVVEGYSFFETFTSYIANVNILGLILGGILYVIGKRRYIICFLPVIIGILWSIITFQRWILLFSLTLFVVSSGYVSFFLPVELKRKMVKRIIKTGMFITVLFIVFTVFLLSVRLDIESSSDSKDLVEIIFKSVHSYFVGNIVNFDKFLQNPHNYSYGTSLFRTLFKWFARAGLYDENLVIKSNYEFRWIGFTYINTYTYLRTFFEDFGYLGTVVISFMWGLITYGVVHSYLKKFTLFRLYFVGMFIHAVLLSFFSFALTNLLLIAYILLLIMLINWLTPNMIITYSSDE
jgi:oligosaccharide repeat unit polymerase